MIKLNDIYESESKAEKFQKQLDYKNSILNHENSLELIEKLSKDLRDLSTGNDHEDGADIETKPSTQIGSGTVENDTEDEELEIILRTLTNLKSSISFRVKQLKLEDQKLDEEKLEKLKLKQQQQQQQSQFQRQQYHNSKNNKYQQITTQNEYDEQVIVDPVYETVDDNNSKMIKMINQINRSMILNLNIDLNNFLLGNGVPKKLNLLDQQKINDLEHKLQLINFHELSSKKSNISSNSKNKKFNSQNNDSNNNNNHDSQKVEILHELSSIYANQLANQSHFILDLIKIISSQNNIIYNTTNESTEYPDTNGYTENIKSYQMVIENLQEEKSSLQRDKVLLEDQVVKLKERWNGLIESARRRKEMKENLEAKSYS
ncbi:unnamed protein product [[Candida] boidinii]|uniref:Unnamed protein product n=1 Tax=Candida boidinii TaxID=5477 RepID=A0A9W6T5B9_CANBO|nr:hypothetical protein B5S30_g40 [[Candida] boidinii]OWB82026.1 hypothetical protein B5S33_g647 [[Candida] boidinii]GME73216.1 unnamed protein product [[Candida] boidinii]GMG06213.1 unnamed protein product [[Candida] boidinii]